MDRIPENVEKEMMTSKFIPCGECEGGYVRYQKDGYDFWKPCDCYKKYSMKKKQESCNIPEMYFDAKFDLKEEVSASIMSPKYINNKYTFENRKIDINAFGEEYVRVQKEYLKQSPRKKSKGLFLTGFVGSGKTYFSNAIALKFIEHGYNAYYIKAEQYISLVKRSYKNESDEKKLMFINASNYAHEENCHLLVLDELGYEYHKDDSGFALSQLKDLLRNRSEKMYPTIITTNMKPDEIEQMYGPEIISMLYESYIFIQVLCREDYRAKLNGKNFEDFDVSVFMRK